jgi:hypothetical protein
MMGSYPPPTAKETPMTSQPNATLAEKALAQILDGTVTPDTAIQGYNFADGSTLSRTAWDQSEWRLGGTAVEAPAPFIQRHIAGLVEFR